MDNNILVLIAVFVLIIYFSPSIIAISRKKRNASAIFALNLFLGWSFLGWVISLVWALTKDSIQINIEKKKKEKPEQVYQGKK